MHQFQPLLSDCQSKISACIKASVKHRRCSLEENEQMPDGFKWNKYSSERFRKALGDRIIHNKINHFMNRQFSCDKVDIENACDFIENLVLQAPTKTLKIKSSTKVKKNKQTWYNEEPYIKRRQ